MQITKIDTFSGHRDCVYTLAPSTTINQFFSAGGDGTVVRWDFEKPDLGELIAQVPSSIYAICFDHQRNHLWVGQNYEGIHLIDVEQKKEINSNKITGAAIFEIKIHEHHAFIGLSDGTVVVMDVEQFLVKKHIKASDKSVRSIAINPITEEFVVAYSDFSIKVFDLKDFSLKLVLTGHQNSVFKVCFSPDYKYLLSSGRDAHLKVWDVNNGYHLHKDIVAHLFAINDLVFNPTGELFATCSMDKSIKIWDATNFKLLKVIDRGRHAGHGTSINKVLWSSYTDYLISASDDKHISIWQCS